MKYHKSLFHDTTKHQLAEICFNLAMQICEDNQTIAIARINQERDIIGKKPKRDLYFWANWKEEKETEI